MAGNTPALRKRQQIENANKTMFLWVALAAAIVGISSVLGISMFQRISFKQDVIDSKNTTVGILEKNNKTAATLKNEVRVLNTNQALLDTPRIEGSEPLSVILDALPSNPNSSALGASLQQKLLRVDGVTIESLVVDPISGVEDSSDEVAVEGEEASESKIMFRFTVSAPAAQESGLSEVLRNIERSIRVINLTSLSVEQQGGGGKITMTVEGEAYYKPATTVSLKEKLVP